ncbi:SLAM family member 8-like [Octodon degus]|uniref:SLAM family member 8-like n=1 Tax=Octodon degus TaxID=10160 RepID=A0A6P6EBL7_OCTDE|nr:SLAM family member 8-like [Octodon degus]
MYKARVQVPNMTSVKIENLTPQDSGNYKVHGLLTGGKEFTQYFHLKVYEPVSPPKSLVKALSITTGWCNVTLECRVTGATEDLNVTWENRGLPRELEQRWTLTPGPNTWTLAVSLPQSQADASLSCVISNPMDQNNATSDLSDICSQGISRQYTASLIGGLLGVIVTVLLLLGAGLYLWKIHKKKKMVMKQGARLERDQNMCDHDIMYAEVTGQKSQEHKDKGTDEQHLEEKGPLTTVYSEVGVLSKPLKMI